MMRNGTPAQTLRTARFVLDRQLANIRTAALETQEGRAWLDELPENFRRMFKSATWTL